MKKKKLAFYVLCLTFSFILGGCSQVTELSAADEDRIADYCAKTVAKFNSLKPQGILNLSKKGDMDAEEETAGDAGTAGEATDAATGDVSGAAEGVLVDGTGDMTAGVSVAEGTGDGATARGDADDASLANAPALSLTEAVGVPGLVFTYDNAREVSYYAMGGYYDISPASGNDFLVLTFHVANTTEADVVLDIPTTAAKFRAYVGGAANTADNTILLNDLSNYSGTLSPGVSEEMVLLFQFPPESLTDLGSVHLQMIQGDTTVNIIL